MSDNAKGRVDVLILRLAEELGNRIEAKTTIDLKDVLKETAEQLIEDMQIPRAPITANSVVRSLLEFAGSVESSPAAIAEGQLMPYVRRGAAFRRRGFGQVSDTLLALENAPASTLFGTSIYNPTTGAYQGGNSLMDWYCNSWLGQATDPSTCAIPSLAQIQASQTQELAATSAPASVQQAAIAAGTASVTAACQANPADCIAQNAAALYPQASALFGPDTVGSIAGVQPDGSVNLFAGWGTWALIGAAALAGLIVLEGR